MKFDKNQKKIIIALVVAFILFLIIRLVIAASSKKEDVNNENNVQTSSNTTDKAKNEARIKKLKKVEESERIRIYLGEYFKFLENKDYESAYNLLYGDFKDKYFPTIEKYKEYIEKCNYPAMIAINYNEITTQGYYYIVTLDIKNLDPDAINSAETVKENTKFVLKENDYDDFYLSFQL